MPIFSHSSGDVQKLSTFTSGPPENILYRTAQDRLGTGHSSTEKKARNECGKLQCNFGPGSLNIFNETFSQLGLELGLIVHCSPGCQWGMVGSGATTWVLMKSQD